MNGASVSVLFDYTALSDDVGAAARAIADRIRNRFRVAYLDAGRELIGAKDKLGHGHFGRWLKAEFDMTERTAERYMQCARWAEDKSDILSGMTPSAVYQLAAPSTPAEIQDTVLARVAAGENVRVAEINSLCSNARYEAKEEARRAANAARLARLSPRARQARAAREAAYEQEQRDREAKRAAEEAAGEKAAALIVANLQSSERKKLAEIIGDRAHNFTGGYHFKDELVRRLMTALETEGDQ